MTLVDTSIWVDHLRLGVVGLADLLDEGGVVMHPFVLGEIACGSLSKRSATLALLHALPEVAVAETHELLKFIESHRLHGRGIGYVDAHLLASVFLADARLWTADKRLSEVALSMGRAYRTAHAH